MNSISIDWGSIISNAESQLSGATKATADGSWELLREQAKGQLQEKAKAKPAPKTKRQRLVEHTQSIVKKIVGEPERQDYEEPELLGLLLFIANSICVRKSSVNGIPPSPNQEVQERIDVATADFYKYLDCTWNSAENMATIKLSELANSMRLFGSSVHSWFVNECSGASIELHLYKKRKHGALETTLPVRVTVKVGRHYGGRSGYIYPYVDMQFHNAGEKAMMVVMDRDLPPEARYIKEGFNPEFKNRIAWISISELVSNTTISEMPEV